MLLRLLDGTVNGLVYRGHRFSAHALERMKEMGVWSYEVVDAITRPELRYPTYGGSIFVRGRLAIVYNEDRKVVVTILWHQSESREEGMLNYGTA